jgi:hypothetical protein
VSALPADVQGYVDAIATSQRPLFDRLHDLILGAFPAVEVTMSYDMPTYAVGERRLYVAAWKSWVSLYGWDAGRDGGFLERHPELSSGRGTIKLRPSAAKDIGDDELLDLVRGALAG